MIGKASSLEAGMQIRSPEVVVRFPVASLVSRRSFIFARAGFGKSNLIFTLIRADGMLKIPLDAGGLSAGAQVEVVLF